ncbi:hypothetical protein AAHC03_09853 [Spirometra sp. Aus1]
MAVEPPWLSELLTSFHERDVHQSHGYDVVFRNYANIQDRMLKLHDECAQLHRENKSLQKENQTLTVKAALGNQVDSQDTKDKLFRLQEEVTELHREKGKLASDVINLTKTVQTKDQVVQKQANSIVRLEEIVRELQERNRTCLSELNEVKNANQVLLDEQAATMLTVKSVESKNRLLEENNAKLIRQIRILQHQVEELKNFESDVKFRLQREAVQRGLLDAAAAQVSVEGQTAEVSGSFALATVPTKALAKADSPEDVNCVRFSPSGSLFCSGGLDRKVSIWKVVNDKCELQAALVGCNAGVSAVDFNPHETMVLGASSDFACRVWTLSDNRLKINLTGHSERVLAARFMGDSNRVVTTSADRTIKLWDLDKRQCTRTLLPISACHDVVACCSLQSVISGHFDKKLRIWDQRSGTMTNEVSLSGRITGLDLSPDGSYILACTRNDSLHTIELRQNEVVRSFQADGFHINSDFVRPCFSPDGQYVASGSQDGGVYIWNAMSGTLETVLRGHENMVICASWSPLGHCLVSCERGRRIIVWSQF